MRARGGKGRKQRMKERGEQGGVLNIDTHQHKSYI